MTITKRTEVSQNIDPNGNISVRTTSVFEENGVEVARAHHRAALEPGVDVTSQPAEVRAVASAVWTPTVVSRAAAARAAALARLSRVGQ